MEKCEDHVHDPSKHFFDDLKGSIQVFRNADGGGGVTFSAKKRYEAEGVRFKVISVMRGWVGV